MAILSSLGIEWQQLLAQAVNFAVIASLLTFFLYRPVLRALDERRERVRMAMEHADRMERQAKEFEKIRLEKLKAIDQEAAELQSRMKKDVEETRQHLLATADREAKAIVARAERERQEAEQRMEHAFQERAVSLITSLASKVLQREFTPADTDRIAASIEKDLSAQKRA